MALFFPPVMLDKLFLPNSCFKFISGWKSHVGTQSSHASKKNLVFFTIKSCHLIFKLLSTKENQTSEIDAENTLERRRRNVMGRNLMSVGSEKEIHDKSALK